MNKYLEKDINNLKDTLKALRTVKSELEDAKEKNYYVTETLPYDFRPSEIERRISYYKAMIEVAEYYQEKLGDKESFKFGKYTGIDIDICQGSFRFGFYLINDEVESKLYDRIFGSHSGINEWFKEHFIHLLSVCLGDTNYSHAFGSHDLTDFDWFFKRFGMKDKDCLLWGWEEFEKDVTKAKKIIDWLVELSNKKEFFEDFDKVLDLYFETVFKFNQEED